jgi:hypothetical protein
MNSPIPEDLTKLMQQAFVMFNDFKSQDFVVEKSIPILYFGDLNKYLYSIAEG